MTSSRENNAVATFNEGNNCAQAMLVAFSSEIKIDRKECLKLGNPFGAGMGFTQETCGVVTGALMVLGLITGSEDLKNTKDREKCYDKTRLFLERFSARHGNILCRELVHCDISTPKGRIAAEKEGVFENKCVPLIRSAVQIVEGIL